MNRPVNRAVLSAYLDDELDPGPRARVEARLARSVRWRVELEEIRAAREAVRALRALDAPAPAWARILDAVATADDLAPHGPDLRRGDAARPRSHTRWVGGAVAAAVAASLVFVAVLPSDDDVVPDVAAFVDAHSASASVADDPVSSLAGVGVTVGSR